MQCPLSRMNPKITLGYVFQQLHTLFHFVFQQLLKICSCDQSWSVHLGIKFQECPDRSRYLFEDQICLPSIYITTKRQNETLGEGRNHVCFCELQAASGIQLRSGCSGQAKWFCWHVHSGLDMRSTVSPVIDDPVMVWPLHRIMNMCCLAISCSILQIPSPYSYMQVLWCVQGCSTYLGAAPIVHVLKTSKADVIITSRVADAALFLAPMVFPIIQLSHATFRHLNEQLLVIGG